MRILVLDGNQNQAVACVRSLNRAGHTVLVGESSPWSKAGCSRSCHATFQYVAPQQRAEDFVNGIVELARAEPGTLVLPLTEATTLPLSVHRNLLFSAGACMVLPSHVELLRAFDKDQTTRLAASLGIAVPGTILVSSTDEAERVGQTIRYPVILKPRASQELCRDGVVRSAGRPRYASTVAQFRSSYNDMICRSSAVLVQEYVKGEGTGYFALMRHGELRAEFAHRRIRDVYPSGSGSAMRVSVKPDPEIREAALAMLRALNWHGVAMVEFRWEKGRAPVFLEVNGRFWHSLALACYAGVDFPALLARMAETGDVEPVLGYRVGVHCRWLLGDFRHLVEVWCGTPSGFPESYPGRMRTLASVLLPVPGTRHDLLTWTDPLPEVVDWLNFAWRVANYALPQKGINAEGRCSHP